jgi:FKBP-type peptidyl-prolyl cis-trans isomerase
VNRLTAFFALAAALALAVVACNGGGGGISGFPTGTPTRIFPTVPTTELGVDQPPTITAQPTTTASGLQIYDIKAGTGAEAVAGGIVYLRWKLWLDTGQQVQNEVTPVRFRLREDQVIEGWVEGIPGMREGGTRRLVVPPELAYGEDGLGGGTAAIPPNATLTYDIELVEAR